MCSWFRLRWLPLMVLCCLGLLGLIFAGVIVIALIPLYLQRHDINGRQRESGIIQTIYNLPASDGSLNVGGQVPQLGYEVLQNIVRG
ncbi:unnamed protein product [Didymodactylos carnosus]|uniref:Uncharacterized protein n=1 Tax=Didymodactylos carnosus TaxID=1234261 RepID=A0A815NAF7_9BILA|nr:unnamed protein product [Didymodactylos carnosus]CAF1434567.1 unnamed protein product [Didymodactylos carnosus]CAF4022063.1 unnamed protein product [Didymodactylos carnosus]CAF4312353.1 unnamed protein product [Didymodactylos carnosus]